ncbi:pseudouridine synthase [Pseudaminobacter salicylatoxidans]|uniref:Pseudouridine synthase n=1 Tax=Pseudaminobacter salicylatoxidans TaxID=93369 RepID=A0A316BSU1_PSESE|nr:pseudouridine synthase [Pseudaminobacter salicylatoxidans]PWJ76907.1 pseudouridine synthase [Pseudaminobacter salicylatoxidans]
MDDDHKKSPRKGGFKAGGARGGSGAPRKGGKPGFAGKPRAEGAKPFGKRGERDAGDKPRFQRRDEATGSERPRRDFSRDDRPREDGEGGFRKPSRFEGKPYEKRTGPRPGRAEREGAQGREFSRENRNEDARRERPQFERSHPKREGGFEGRRRPEGGKPQAARHGSGPRKPFERANAVEEAPGERIAKRLARVGIASRRDAEELIAAGRVRVNGQVLTSPAFNVMPQDRIELDDQVIPPVERTRLFLFHKPAGVVTTNRDPEGRKTVFDILPADLPRLMTVGRLDINTEGLLLLTNDGGLSRVLELPATGWLRRYRARVHGKVDEKQLAGLKEGIAVDGVFYGSVEASLDREQGTNAWLTLGLREGKNREVRNILGALGLTVTRLIRISYGPFQLGELPEGHVQELSGRTLRDQLGERLIEEAGANFDADIIKPFSNKPVRRETARPEGEAPARAPRGPRPLEIGEGGLIKRNRKREQERHREDMRDRLQTKPDRSFGQERGERPDRGGKFKRAEKPGEHGGRSFEAPGQRKANVWMAPGARPIGKGNAGADKAEAPARKSAKPHHGKPFFDKPGGGKSGFGKPRREGDGGKGPRGGGDRPSGSRGGKGNADRRR